MRAAIPKKEIKKFFDGIYTTSGINLKRLATKVNLNERTLRDWRKGRYKPKLEILQLFSRLYRIPLPIKIHPLREYWYTVKGGYISGRKHGFRHLTPEIRRMAAYKAMRTRIKQGDKFFLTKTIRYPAHNIKLAEFIGILLGDGGIAPRQVTITLNKKEDTAFTQYVARLIYDLFELTPSIREDESVNDIVISRTRLVKYLQTMQLAVGSKVRQQITVPSWISKNGQFIKACMRGLFDTDGCFYIDRHYYKKKVYLHCAMNFTNRSLPLLNFFKKNLERFEFHPTQKTKFSVFLRNEGEILKYFKEIGSSNPKHYNKFKNFFEQKYGEVPKWS